MFVLDQVSAAPVTGSTISAYLSDAGWAPQTWTWTGVAGILGVVVLAVMFVVVGVGVFVTLAIADKVFARARRLL